VIHCISHVVVASALYSASEEDLETVFCFFVFQETREFPRNIQNLVTLFLVSGQAAQSESLKPLIWISVSAGKKRPQPGSALMYLRICWAAW